MANTNCFESMQCPQCGSFEPFEIGVNAVATVWDSGTTDFREMDWSKESFCHYAKCHLEGAVEDFKREEKD